MTHHIKLIVGTGLGKDTDDRERFALPPGLQRGTIMHYRIYLLGSDDHIRGACDVDCSTDAQAYAEIAGVIGSYPAAEMWHGVRCVGRWAMPLEIEYDAR